MKRKTTFVVLVVAVIALCGLAVACQARGSLGGVIAPSGSDAGEYSESAEYSDGVSAADHDASGAGASEEEWPGQSQGFVGPNGEGSINRGDFASGEEYERAYVAIDGVENEPERVKVADGEGGRSGYDAGFVNLTLDRRCGELAAHEAVWALGGVWCSDTFQWPDFDGTALAVAYFPHAQVREDLEEVARNLRECPEVVDASPSTWVAAELDEGSGGGLLGSASMGGYPVDDAEAFRQYYLDRAGFKEAWEQTRCQGSTCIAVLDSGIDFDHEDLEANVDEARAKNGLTAQDFQTGEEDGTGHGTLVAGVAAAEANNSLGLAGCSYNAEILPIRVIDDDGSLRWGSVLWALTYLMELDDVPDVVNMSFGTGTGDFDSIVQMTRIAVLVQQLRSLHKVVFVAAAGNADAYEELYPASFPGVLCVSGLDKAGTGRWGAGQGQGKGSSYSQHVDLCACASDIATTGNQGVSGGSAYPNKSGTSMAAPQVAAAAALVRAKHPGWGALLVERALEESAAKLAAMGGSSRTDEFGYGALDAASAVAWMPSGSISPFTGSSGSAAMELQVAYQRSLQCTGPDGIPGALERAMAANPDVFAWLYVPGTSVSVPVARRADDADFYLGHDSLGNPSSIGCAFAREGAGDPGGPVTVLYGHSFSAGDLAFTSLHAFEDRGFFSANSEVRLYLPDRVLEYRVTGANPFNARAIEEVDQSDAADLADYFGELSSPDPSRFAGLKRDVRLDPARDRVLQLSTCTVPADPARRFVVTCALVGEEAL